MKNHFITTLLVLCGIVPAFSQNNTNALRFSPVGVNEIGTTVGLSYEKYLSQSSRVSLIFPLDIVFRQHERLWSSNDRSSPAYFYFTPGFKFYPASKERPVKYAIGSNLVLGTGERYYYDSDFNSNGTWQSRYVKANNTRLGVMVTNYVNFDISRRFTMGINLGFGLLYVDKSSAKQNDVAGTVQLNTNFGFKF
ncbi:MAG: hypothetical protein KF870_02510 [Leadbetterella sp.]|nr:hypothetical protein [Leadbetterella sp.]